MLEVWKKNIGELKSISIGNVMEILKISENSWQIAVICQIRQSFYYQCYYCTVGTSLVRRWNLQMTVMQPLADLTLTNVILCSATTIRNLRTIIEQ